MKPRQSNQVPWIKQINRTKTDHEVAVAAMRKGWGKYKNRADWEGSIRFKGVLKP